MYVRRVNGQETTFGTSGALWRDALVMYDRKTGSYWSQVTATSISGPLKGATLQEIPSAVTTWGAWKTMHPETLVLVKPALEGSPFRDYNENQDRLGAMGLPNPDGRLPGKELVIGVAAGTAHGAVPLEHLKEAGVVNGMVGNTPVAWVVLGGEAAAAFDRRVKGAAVQIRREADGTLMVAGAQPSLSRLDPDTGRILSGPLHGQRLERLPALRVFWYSWTSFHPDTTLVE